MCLDLHNQLRIPRIAFRNIKCYKVVDKIEFANGRIVYETPYRRYQITIGDTYASELRKVDFFVYEGLHSFKDLNTTWVSYNDCKKPTVVECIIPRWSLYYKGMFFRVESYASNKLIYLKIVK